VLQQQPDHPVANYVIGQELLRRGDDTGPSHLDAAMAADGNAVLHACEVAAEFLVQQGREAEAERYRLRAGERLDLLDQAVHERKRVKGDQELTAPALAPSFVADLGRRLAATGRIKRAYLARRKLEHLDDEHPSYVLALEFGLPWWKPHVGNPKAKIVDGLVEGLEEIPADISIVDLEDDFFFKRRLKRVAGALIYER